MSARTRLPKGNNYTTPGDDQPSFTTDVEFAWCPTERVGEICGDGPVVTPDLKNRKRTSGLDLLRPRSSKGYSRGDPGIPCPPILSPSITSPPLPLDWSIPRQSKSPQLSSRGVQRDSLKALGRSKHEKDGSWDVTDEYGYDLLPKSVRSSVKIPAIRSRGSVLPVDLPSRDAGAWNSSEGCMQWMSGTLQLQMEGSGGREGGELRIQGKTTSFKLNHLIPPIPSSSGSRRQPLPQLPPWEIPDIQHIHASVLDRPHVLSIRLHGPPKPHHTNSKALGDNPRLARPKTSSGISGVFGLRARGQTFSGRGSLDHDRFVPPLPTTATGPLDRQAIPRSFSTSYEEQVLSAADEICDRTIFLCFTSEKEQDEWYNLFRTLAGSRDPTAMRTHRRLSISILDLTEVGKTRRAVSTGPAASLHDQDKSFEKGSGMSDGETRGTSGQDSGSVVVKKGQGLKAGWTQKDRWCMELRIDDVVRARTTWTKAAGKNSVPFWGEAFRIVDLPAFSTCVLAIYRQSKGKASKIAIVDLSLVSDISSAKDERYAVKSIKDGTVVGEFLIPGYSALAYKLLCRIKNNIDALYDLDHSRSLDGSFDTMAKVGVASGSVYPLLRRMIDREAKGADSTLFRGNTPLSKLLEATLRLLSEDFLKRSIGPTVARLAQETGLASGSLIAQTGEPCHEEAKRVAEQIEACWADLYAARGTLPEPLKVVLGDLYWAVRYHHSTTKERHFAFKAVSSFLFLRLINPALIRPHLFGLRSGLYPSGSQKTATLVARVLSAMSFFSPRDAQRDPELALFSDIISSNSEMMLDYLSSFGINSEPHPRRQEQCNSSIGSFIASRISVAPKPLGDSIPVPSIAGAIDVQAELGVLSAIISHRREGGVQTHGQTLAGGQFVRVLGKNLRNVARASAGEEWGEEDDIECTEPVGTSSVSEPFRSPFHILDPSIYVGIENRPPPSTPWLEHEYEYRYDKASIRQKSRPASPLPSPRPPPLPLQSRSSSPFSAQGPFGIVLETAQRAQHATGALVRRSLSSKRVGRRGSMTGLRIGVPGREADEPGRPKTARR